MPKCDFNKVAKQLCWNCTSALVFSCKVAAYFQNTFSWKYLWMALLLISAVNLQCFIENASKSKNLNSIFLLVAGISISISCTKTAKRCSLSFYLTFSLTDLCEEITLIILANVPSKKTFENIKLETSLPSSKPLQEITRNAEIKLLERRHVISISFNLSSQATHSLPSHTHFSAISRALKVI